MRYFIMSTQHVLSNGLGTYYIFKVIDSETGEVMRESLSFQSMRTLVFDLEHGLI